MLVMGLAGVVEAKCTAGSPLPLSSRSVYEVSVEPGSKCLKSTNFPNLIFSCSFSPTWYAKGVEEVEAEGRVLGSDSPYSRAWTAVSATCSSGLTGASGGGGVLAPPARGPPPLGAAWEAMAETTSAATDLARRCPTLSAILANWPSVTPRSSGSSTPGLGWRLDPRFGGGALGAAAELRLVRFMTETDTEWAAMCRVLG